MATSAVPQSEVPHFENHNKLSSEEIAKAVARHSKNHPVAKVEAAPATVQSAPAKARKGPKS